MSQIYNFSAGPAMLPTQVIKKMQDELLEYGNAKASVMEISHRGADFMALAQKSEADLRTHLNSLLRLESFA
jgi:phosphoserine aminotransferase